MKIKVIFAVLLVLAVLAGCGQDPADVPTEPTELAETVQPTQPAETTPKLEAVAEYEAALAEGIVPGVNEYGFDGDGKRDSYGLYYVYEGGEMHLGGVLGATRLSKAGVGVLLFLDGQPQPYKTAEEDFYSYMHTFYPPLKGTLNPEFIFTPVTGQAGDMLELCMTCVIYPDYFITDGAFPFVQTGGMAGIVARLQLQATPPEQDLPEVTDRMISRTIRQEESAPEDLPEGEIDWDFTVNSTVFSGFQVTGITQEAPVTLRYTLWGCPDARFGLVFYVDHVPVSVAPEDTLLLSPAEGQKTVIEAEIDMTGFDGESVVYAVLVPRNFRSSDLGISCFLPTTQAFYLSD